MRIEDALEMAWKELDKWDLTEKGWTVATHESQKFAGVCHHSARVITLCEKITERAWRPAVLDTILHEIAHALVGPGHGHDEVWAATCRNIGGSGVVGYDDGRHLDGCQRL